MVVMVLVIIAANIVIGLLGSGVNGAAGRIVLQLISFVVGVVLAMGLIRAALAVVEGRAPEVNMLFQTDGFIPYLFASIIFGLAVFFGLVLLIVPGIIIAIMWHFFGYVIVEHPETGVLESLNRSAEITRVTGGSCSASACCSSSSTSSGSSRASSASSSPTASPQ